ncbi:MAG TPA: nicotinamide-nucleotide amidohydrolase family protein [Gaiellaceae bacterium]
MARPRAVVLLTGSELVRGTIRDENGPFLCAELTARGLEPIRVVTVGDRSDELEAALRECVEADLCVISGGLGPTHDDRTIETLALVTGRGLETDEALRAEIDGVSRGVAERLRRPFADFSEGIAKQATLPEGGVSLGLAGTAPAVLLEHDGRVAVALPGPPGELRRLWPAALEHAATRAVLARAERVSHRVLRFFGPTESAVARAIAESGGEGDGLELTVCARDLEIQVDLLASDGSPRAEAVENALRERFAAELFAEDERPVQELVLEACRAAGLTLATAESCTGGLVAARLTSIPGSSDVYLGGVVAYADTAKEELLAVPVEVLARDGAVSAAAAAAMATGTREALGADVAVSVTGVAGPGGGSAEKPVGLVHLHAITPESEEALELRLPGDRDAIRSRATATALHLLRRLLTQSGTLSRASSR